MTNEKYINELKKLREKRFSLDKKIEKLDKIFEKYKKVKKWRITQKQIELAGKYGNLICEAVKEQLDFQIINGVEASIDTINYFLEKKDVDAAQIALEQLKRQVNILSKMIKKGVFDKCIN